MHLDSEGLLHESTLESVTLSYAMYHQYIWSNISIPYASCIIMALFKYTV